MNELGEWVKQVRTQNKITQRELAEKLGMKKPQQIANIERGVATFPARYVKRFCQATGQQISELVNMITQQYRRQLAERIERSE